MYYIHCCLLYFVYLIFSYSIAVVPTVMQMLGEKGNPLRNNTVIGPLIDGDFLVSYCEARGGRPKPNVKWYVDGKALAGEFIHRFKILLYSIWIDALFFILRYVLSPCTVAYVLDKF